VSLKDRIAAMIRTEGPLPVSVYMTLCLHDPEEGYYATHAGIGRDFITAPETSQAFGELIGLWAAHEWRAMGAPDPLQFVELGPGRATLMADALRATEGQADFRGAIYLGLVEASPLLRELQSRVLANATPTHHGGLGEVPPGPVIFLANEFLDCLPARQFARTDGQWHERVIGLTETGELTLGIAGDVSPDAPAFAPDADQDAAEVQPGLEAVITQLAGRGAPFRALFIDYGPADGAPGDTLRAFQNGVQVDPFTKPGACDLTVDVDFSRLKRLAEAAGLAVAEPIPQGGFLMALGLQDRLDQLVKANPGEADTIFTAIRRLADPAEMGERFKVICLSSPGLPPPAGF